jgi:hypothetical protein
MLSETYHSIGYCSSSIALETHSLASKYLDLRIGLNQFIMWSMFMLSCYNSAKYGVMLGLMLRQQLSSYV